MQRLLGLSAFLVAAAWELRWEIVRAFFYDRGFHFMGLMEAETWIHWGPTAVLVGCGIYLFWRTGDGKTPSLNLKWPGNKAANNQASVPTDWPIRGLFAHIRPDYPLTSVKTVDGSTTDNLDDRWKPIGDDVIKQLSTGRLHATGRKEAHRPLRHLAPAPIPQSYWQSAKFTFYFLDHDGKNMEHVVNDDGIRYSDLELDRAEALAIWPLEAWPDFKKWDAKKTFELYEAACLWFNIEPRLPMPDRPLSKYQEMRQMTFGGGLPVESESIRHSIDKAMKKDSSVTPHTVIGREILEVLAEHEGYQPLFLFPYKRGEK